LTRHQRHHGLRFVERVQR
ncbi:hypothetical protein STIAU_2126, partial [Stigmatella aurantiaca DW4/3-1]